MKFGAHIYHSKRWSIYLSTYALSQWTFQ